MVKTQPQLSEIPTAAKTQGDEPKPKASRPKYALNGVVPTGASSLTVPKSQVFCDSVGTDADCEYSLSFWQAFGPLGPPILVLLVICILWTLWLILLTLAPNQTANGLMDTGDYENGLFWFIVEDSAGIKVLSVLGLVSIELYYVYLLARVLVWRTVQVPLLGCFHRQKNAIFWNTSAPVCGSATSKPSFQSVWEDLTGIHGKYRKFWNMLLKVLDLVVETIALRGYLSDGFPPILNYGWAGFVSVNSLSCALNILLRRHSALSEILLDSLFDLVAAVLYPILVLMYCREHFDFNHGIINLFQRTVHPNSFDDMGRLFANQAQMTLFRVNFDSLRIQTVLDLFLRIAMNLSFCSRFHAVIAVLIRTQRRKLYPRRPTLFRVRVSKPVPRLVATAFLAFSALVLAYTHVATQASWRVCSPHPECVVYVHRFPWTSSDKDLCPCRAMIDEELYVVAWEQWEHLVDVTDKVKVLAAAGELRTLRLINRQLVTFPEELKQCSRLQHLALVHTETEEIPAWASQWNELEYFHIEGKPGGPSLVRFPSGLFQDMPSLTVINVAQHPLLDNVPVLNGVPNLRSLVLASLPLVHALNFSFATIPAVSQLVLFDLPRLAKLPDMAPLQQLDEFSLIKPSHVCCNGFLAPCDQADSFCAAGSEQKVPAAECIDPTESDSKATDATLAVFQRFAHTTCHGADYLTGMADSPTRERTEMCDYTFFQRCEFPPGSGQIGMCIPYRMRVLSCTLNEAFMEFRRSEITELGMPCNPLVEAWLGCTN
ncbi:hypothetical protein PHYPSEUDO_004257 [Phytophthora pseudosyringae]|uniref:WLGC domain-containing protein n=1 Tax=Phytophthora pseudosyringae TaxID=221518 RepID=A0A8T1VNM5_9STRA|nr:hypothetical protein PHYPSEUDO_004257 [Phytophthora pseudosyringae]